MNRRLVFLILILGVLLSGCGEANPEQEALPTETSDSQTLLSSTMDDEVDTPEPIPTEQLTHIRLPMGYIPTVQYAPLYVAEEKGYFSEAGFEVEFDHRRETDGLVLAAAGEVPFAVVSGEQVLLARAQDLPVVYVAAWFQDFPVAVAAKTESGIETPEDLKGKRIGIPGLYGASYIGFRALLYAAGIEETDVILDSIEYTQVEMLATNQNEAVVVYVTNEPVQLRALGYEVNVIRVADYVHLAANGIITNETMIAEKPEAVRRFVKAILLGLEYTIEHPDEAYEISKNYVEGLAEADEAVQMEVLMLSIEFWQADQLGYSERASWENMQDVLLHMGLLAEPLDLDAAFTNEFIE